MLLLSAGSVWAQEDARVTRAIEQLGSELPVARAQARKTILQMGKPALDVLRRAVSASSEVLPEHLLMVAEDLARERRGVRFALSKDLQAKSWHVEWRPGGQQLAILHDFGGTVRIFDAELKPTGDHFGDQTAYFAFDPQDKSLAYNHGAGEVVVESKSGRRVSIPVRDKPMLAYSPDGRYIATGGYGRVVEMWSVADGANVRRFPVDGTEGGLVPVFSPDGKLLVVGNRNDKTNIFEVATGKELHVLGRRQTHQPVFSPDGTLLAISYVDGKIGIWNPATGTLEKLLDGEAEEVFTLAWSPDGRILASAGLSGPIVIWSREHLARLHRLDPGSERTFSLAFRPDGKMLVAAGNHTTRAWTIESMR
jgi:WD40 repeat protein